MELDFICLLRPSEFSTRTLIHAKPVASSQVSEWLMAFLRQQTVKSM